MQKSYEEVRKEIEISFRFVLGDKDRVDFNDFLEFHRNIYYVQPKENLTNFQNVI
jgi:hypothetical protein